MSDPQGRRDGHQFDESELLHEIMEETAVFHQLRFRDVNKAPLLSVPALIPYWFNWPFNELNTLVKLDPVVLAATVAVTVWALPPENTLKVNV